MRSMPPASSHLADSPVPAPPPIMGMRFLRHLLESLEKLARSGRAGAAGAAGLGWGLLVHLAIS